MNAARFTWRFSPKPANTATAEYLTDRARHTANNHPECLAGRSMVFSVVMSTGRYRVFMTPRKEI